MESAVCLRAPAGILLIETLAYRPGLGMAQAALHLARMAASARVLGYPFEEATARKALAEVAGRAPLRVRLTCDADGVIAVKASDLAPSPRRWRVMLSEQVVRSDDPWLRHKTTQRALYDAARANLPPDCDEMLFANERGEICEGTITNLFLRLRDGRLVTPALSSGLLPGILRQRLLERGLVSEAVVTGDMLRQARCVAVGNSLRGLIRCALVGGLD